MTIIAQAIPWVIIGRSCMENLTDKKLSRERKHMPVILQPLDTNVNQCTIIHGNLERFFCNRKNALMKNENPRRTSDMARCPRKRNVTCFMLLDLRIAIKIKRFPTKTSGQKLKCRTVTDSCLAFRAGRCGIAVNKVPFWSKVTLSAWSSMSGVTVVTIKSSSSSQDKESRVASTTSISCVEQSKNVII